MATARYDKKYEGWILEYTDHTKVAQGKRGDSKKKQKDRTYPTLSKRQQKLKEAQMLNFALELEAKSRRGIVTTDNADKPILAIEYLPNMQVVSKSQRERAVRDRRKLIAEFVDFLMRRYKKFICMKSIVKWQKPTSHSLHTYQRKVLIKGAGDYRLYSREFKTTWKNWAVVFIILIRSRREKSLLA